MVRNRKGQSMLEYLLIVGTILAVIIVFTKDRFAPVMRDQVLGDFTESSGVVSGAKGSAGALATAAVKLDIE